jgi:formylglycine-generating enzyme required for sulfatase activity
MLMAGASQQFSAVVANTDNTAVSWKVQEGASGGTITQSGRYTAPNAAGQYHVVACCAAAADTTAVATVTVTTPPPPDNTRVNPIDGAEMVRVPAGEFRMGSAASEGWGSERPQHTVYLDGYWIYKYEVTVKQYRAFCAATGHAFPTDTPSWGWQDTHPIMHVTWFDAQAYAAWAHAALPTEAQWEKAARGTDARMYPWGNDYDPNKLAQSGNSTGTQPVGSFPAGASPYGALDMAGNVWEWCADWFAPEYYADSPSRNPTGPESGAFRVLRGGSWHYLSDTSVRCAARNNNDPYGHWDGDGFRCAVAP